MDAPTKMIRLLIVDDHQMVRDGIKVMLESKEDFLHFDIDEAENGEIAIGKVIKKDFDIVLMDYQLPGMNGPQTVSQMRLYKKDLKILVLSNYDEFSNIKSMISEGVNGYIIKNIDPAELVKAIETVLNGKPYYSNDVALKIIDSAKNSDKPSDAAKNGLSKRELEILKLIALEKTNEQIAKQLFISKRTVDTHRQNLLNKLQVKNTAGLVKAAYEFKLL